MTLGRLAGGSGPAGIALNDLPVDGYMTKDTNAPVALTLRPVLEDRAAAPADFIPTPRALTASLPRPESHRPKTRVELFHGHGRSDRQQHRADAHGRGQSDLFEELVQSLQDLRDDIQASARGAVAYLRSVDVEVRRRGTILAPQSGFGRGGGAGRLDQCAPRGRARRAGRGPGLAASPRGRPPHARGDP